MSQVKIRDVYKDTPAQEGKLRPGDIVLSVAGKLMHHSPSFRNALIEATPGDTVEIEVWRSGRKITTNATLSER